MTRRTFSTAAFAAAGYSQTGSKLPIRKACLLSMVDGVMSVDDKFAVMRDAGYDAAEVGHVPTMQEAEEIKKASDRAKLPIHSVMNMQHWKTPLSNPDPAVARQTVEAMRLSFRQANLWGADTVLLVPAVVNADVRYEDAWQRSRQYIQELLPDAEKHKVVIAVENVWNKFLLSPREMNAYVDSFQSPYVKAYFDVGNILLYGYPQDWIRTLGKNRIQKLHFKDFKFTNRQAQFVNLKEGELDWKAVHGALAEIGWSGYTTVELAKGNASYLADVAKRVDQILAGV